jgi:hypothetical protein
MAAARDGLSRARRGGSRLFRRYLATVLAAVAAASGGVLAVNAAIDPLWYGRGNIVTGENFAFNERFAKLNRFLRTLDQYDCVILGSSRSTFLDQRRFKDHVCANLAFSAGIVPEYVAYAKYIKARGFSPKLVIVGVDAFNFWNDMTPVLPDFVESGESPPDIVRSYLSADVLRMSIRTLLGHPPFPRFYDRNFVGLPWRKAPIYDPPKPDQLTGKSRQFHSSRQGLYSELRELFPNAEFIGYVPPLSAWLALKDLYLTENFEEYLRTMKAIAERFDAMIDFSIPSDITMCPKNTYDGDHYKAAINAVIADVLQGKTNHFGFDVRAASLPEYQKAYENAAIKFLNTIQDPDPDDGC